MNRQGALLAGGAALGALGWWALTRKRIDLAGRVVVVTGGSRGLGLALAREFGARGARLAICGRDAASLERARAELAERGFDVFAAPCDVRSTEACAAFIRLVMRRFGAIDIVVNNAGIISVGPASEMTARDYEDALRTHFWGAYHTIEAALPALAESPSPAIVNIVSIGGMVAVPHLLPYSASKFALLGYSLGLREELGARGISVTTVCPGLMRTGSPRNALFKGRNLAEYAWFSLGASLPFTSIAAATAARRIVRATRHGASLLVLSRQAKLLALVQHLTPRLAISALTVVARLLPPPGGAGSGSRRGHESESPLSQSALTRLGREAAKTLNQLAG